MIGAMANPGHERSDTMHHYNAHVCAYRLWLRNLNAMWGYRTR